MDKNFKISIIMPVYNVESFLRDSLDSILKQTLTEFELICVDDKSQDKSLEILKEYAQKDSRIKVIQNEKNCGPSVARNKGLDVAVGEFISFIDSDDWIDEKYFEQLYEKAVKYKADIACGNLVKVYENKEKYFVKITKEKVFSTIEDKIKATKMRTHCYICNKIYRREIIEKNRIRFKEGMFFEDMVFTPQILYFSDKLVLVRSVNYYYRHNPNSIVNVLTKQKQEDYRKAIAIIKAFAQEKAFAIPRNLTMKNWKKYKIFGFQVLKEKTWDYEKEFYLFGFIPFLKITWNEYQG